MTELTESVSQFAPDHDGGDVAFFEIGEDVDVHEKPVGQDDEGFDAAVEQHFQIALEAAAFVVNVGENGKVGRLVKRIFDAAENQGAVGIGHVEDHDADGVAALAAQGAGKKVGTIAQFLGSAFDAFLGGGGNVAGQRSVVENDGDGGRGEAALLGDVANCDHGAFHAGCGTRVCPTSKTSRREIVFRPSRACSLANLPTAYAVGFILAPLRG